jgi:CHASE3 domain sensor protein
MMAAGRFPSRVRIIATIAVATLTILVVVSILVGRARSRQQFLASIQDDPLKVLEATSQGRLSGEDGYQAMMLALRNQIDRRLDEYFSLPAGAPREQYLDRLIEQMQSRRREVQTRAATRPAIAQAVRELEQRAGPDRARRMQAMMEQLPPQRRAQMAEMAAAVMKRRLARGLPPLPPTPADAQAR